MNEWNILFEKLSRIINC